MSLLFTNSFNNTTFNRSSLLFLFFHILNESYFSIYSYPLSVNISATVLNIASF